MLLQQASGYLLTQTLNENNVKANFFNFMPANTYLLPLFTETAVERGIEKYISYFPAFVVHI